MFRMAFGVINRLVRDMPSLVKWSIGVLEFPSSVFRSQTDHLMVLGTSFTYTQTRHDARYIVHNALTLAFALQLIGFKNRWDRIGR